MTAPASFAAQTFGKNSPSITHQRVVGNDRQRLVAGQYEFPLLTLSGLTRTGNLPQSCAKVEQWFSRSEEFAHWLIL